MMLPVLTNLSGVGVAGSLMLGSCFCGAAAIVASRQASQDPDVRRFANRFREHKIPENLISKLITNPRPFGQNFLSSVNSLLALATEQNHDVDQFTLAINQLFKVAPPPEEMQIAQRAILEDSQSDYPVGEGREVAKLGPVEMQFLFLSKTMLHLRRHPEVLPQLDRAELSRRYDHFCESRLIPHCNDYFGEVQSRFVSAYVNSLQPAIRGEEGFNFAGLSNRCAQLREIHEGMEDVPLQDLRRLAIPQQEENSNPRASEVGSEIMQSFAPPPPPPPPSDSVRQGGISNPQASAVAANVMQR